MYKYAVLKTEGGTRDDCNPLFLHRYESNIKGKYAMIIHGCGKVTQIAYKFNCKDITLVVDIDGEGEQKINNGYCAEAVTNCAGRGDVIFENLAGEDYRMTFFIPFIFKKNIKIIFEFPEKTCHISDVHVYYEVPNEKS